MDYYMDKLQMLIEEKEGVVSAQDFRKAGFDRMMQYDLLARGLIRKVSHGQYVLADGQPDEYKIIQNRSEKLIYSYGTALHLHGMSDRIPHNLDITVPQGDNISRIKKDYPHICFHYCKKEVWDLGIMEIATPEGCTVKAYDPERCICDLIRDREKIDTQVYVQAIKEYFQKRCDPRKIIKYARLLNIETRIRNYMEVLQ